MAAFLLGLQWNVQKNKEQDGYAKNAEKYGLTNHEKTKRANAEGVSENIAFAVYAGQCFTTKLTKCIAATNAKNRKGILLRSRAIIAEKNSRGTEVTTKADTIASVQVNAGTNT